MDLIENGAKAERASARDWAKENHAAQVKSHGSIALAAHEIKDIFRLRRTRGVARFVTAILAGGRSRQWLYKSRRIGRGCWKHSDLEGSSAVTRNCHDMRQSRILTEDRQRFILRRSLGVEIFQREGRERTREGDANCLPVANSNRLCPRGVRIHYEQQDENPTLHGTVKSIEFVMTLPSYRKEANTR